jgi:hypothetical protein
VLNPRKRRNKEERDTASNALSHDCGGEEQVGVELLFCPEADSPPGADDGVTLAEVCSYNILSLEQYVTVKS